MPRVTASQLSNTQVHVLKILAKHPEGLEREELSAKVGVSLTYDVLGPAYQEYIGNHPRSLMALGYVESQKPEPGKPTLFAITEEGLNLAGTFSARKRNANGDKVPPNVLDKQVIALRQIRPYGLELFTDDDIKEIRSKLPSEYHSVPVDGLRQQIVNRRKVGAYKTVTQLPKWYVEYRNTEDFQNVASKLLDSIGCRCTLNSEHDLPENGDNINHVYHRTFEDKDGNCVLGRELMKYLIALCPQCYNRQQRFMCKIPDSDPR